MAGFDPDAYLNQDDDNSFDPDAYLAESKAGQDESLIRGAAQGLSGNFADEITGATQAMYDDISPFFTGQKVNRPPAKFDDMGRVSNLNEINSDLTYEKHRDESRSAYDAAKETNPGYYLTGEIAGAFASPLNKLAKGASLAKGGAMLGGINAAGVTEQETLGGQAMDTVTGIGLGAGIGFGVDKAAPYIAKLTGAARNALNTFIKNNPKANADQIAKAAEMLGSKATPGMLSESGMVQRLEQSISESPSFWGQSVKNSLDDVYSKSQGAIDEMTSGATNLSPYQLGDKAKAGISMKVGQDLAPSSSIFEEISQQAKNIPISKKGASAIQKNIEKVDDVVVGGLSGKPAYYVERLGNIKNVDQLKKLGTLLNEDIAATQGSERRILIAIKEKLRNAEESNIMRAAEEMSKVSGMAKNEGRDMVSALKEARADYASKMGAYSDLADSSRLGKFSGSTGFLDKIDAIPSERVGDKLFNLGNEETLKNLQKQFPEVYELLKSGAIKDFREAVQIKDANSLAKFTSEFGNLNPESQSRLFGDAVNKGEAVSLMSNSLPKNFNPSGTASQSLWNREAITSNVTDIPRYAYYKLLTSDKAQKIAKSLVERSEQMKQLAIKSPQGFANMVNQLEQKTGVLEAPYKFMRDVTPRTGEKQESSSLKKDDIMQKLNGTKYSQTLQSASQRGDQAFNANHFVLMQKDPEYRRLIMGEQE